MTSLSILSGLYPLPQNIAVFRALQLGDMLCSVPALRALRQALPHAHITLIGLPNATGFMQRFSRYLDHLMVFPGMAGMPEQIARPDALPSFYAAARACRFDLAIQLHGSGGLTNAIVQQLGARHCAGFVPDEHGNMPPDDRFFMPWPDHLPEILRYTALMRHLGIPVGSTDLEFPLSAEDHAGAIQLLRVHRLDPHRTVIVHPGARLASRRWPVQRFAQVANRLAAQGWQIAITGSQDERPITQSLLAAMRDPANHQPADAAASAAAASAAAASAAAANDSRLAAEAVDTPTESSATVLESLRTKPAVDLTGATSLGVLAALVARCRLVVSNDTGISHVAAAVQTPSVVVASGSDVHRWAPLNQERHTVLWHDLPCRPCAHQECPLLGHPCAQAIEPDAVARQACRKLEQGVAHA